jgi:hypothetical protein
VPPAVDLSDLPNVAVHTGDSHQLLAKVLADLARAGRNVDFVLVDGDHTAAGVEQDLRDLLASDAVRSSVIVFHDTINDEVRAGLQRIDYAAEPKVIYCDLNFVAGRLSYGGPFHHELWGGLGVIVVDAANPHAGTATAFGVEAYAQYELLAPLRDALVMRERAGLATGSHAVTDVLERLALGDGPPAAGQNELPGIQRRYEQLLASRSWRITAPLRTAARAIRHARHRGRPTI